MSCISLEVFRKTTKLLIQDSWFLVEGGKKHLQNKDKSFARNLIA
jgi:hypothetical protein